MVAAASSPSLTRGRRLLVALVAWLGMLGLDFLLNAALFARMYQGEGGFLLSPFEAFRRIPLGYLAFLIVALGTVELAYRLNVRGLASGVRLGLVLGAAFAAIWSLGLYSVATIGAEVALEMAGTWVALVVIASAVASAGLGTPSLRGLLLRVGAFDLVCIVTVVALQSSGVVPTIKV